MRTPIFTALAALTLHADVNAQSAQETYKDDCATTAQASADDCSAFRQAISKEATSPMPRPEMASPYPGLDGVVFYDAKSGDAIYVLEFDDGHAVLYSSALGTLGPLISVHGAVVPPSAGGAVSVSPEGWVVKNGTHSFAFSSGNFVGREDEDSAAGVLTSPSGKRIYRRLDAQQASSAIKNLNKAVTAPAIEHNWGVYAKLVGRTWITRSAGVVYLSHFGWAGDFPGLSIKSSTAVVDKNNVTRSSGQYTYDAVADKASHIGSVQSDGSVKSENYQSGSWQTYSIMRMTDSEAYESTGYKYNGGEIRKIGSNVSTAYSNQSLDDSLRGYQQERRAQRGGGGMMAAVTGAMMGAATGYAESGGSSVGAIAGAMGGAVVGSSGGNEALYEQLEESSARSAERAEESRRQLYQTIAEGERRAATERAAAASQQAAQGSGGQSHGERVVAQEQARAEQLRQEREARAAEEQRLAQQEAAARTQREAEARRLAEAERNRPVEWTEGVVLCEPRQNSQEWRCTGPLQMNILKLDTPNTMAQLGLACGSSDGIREIGPVGTYRAFGCGFGIHPTAKNYPGNRDVPADFGVFVSDRRVFHCPATKDAYCRTP